MTVTTMRTRTARGFTLLEIALAFTVIAVLSGIAIPTWRAYEQGSKDQSARIMLSSLEPEITRVIYAHDGDAPEEVADEMRTGGAPETVDGSAASTAPDIVSVSPLSGDTAWAAVTALSETGACWVMVSTPDSEPRWAVDRDPGDGACRAGNTDIRSATVLGSEDTPSELTLS